MKQGTAASFALVAFLAGAGLTWLVYWRNGRAQPFDEGGVQATCTNSATNKCNGIYMADTSAHKCDVELPVVTLRLRPLHSITWYPEDSYQYQVRFSNSPFPASDSPPYSVGSGTPSPHSPDSGAPHHYFAYSIWYNASGSWVKCKDDAGDPTEDDPGIKIRN